MHQKPITGEAIRTQLERILPSRGFVASQRLCRFLRFVVNRHLEGTADQLKESLIGTEVYDRNSSYDPSQDSIVRTEGRRLRTKLKEYYESEGVNDPVVIHFRLGSYAPQFREQNLPEETVPKRTGGEASVSEGTGVCVAVLPFTDLSGQPLATRCARDLTDELIHELTLTPGVRVAAASAITASANSTAILPELAKKLGVQLVFEGTVREEGGRLRVISRMVNFDGFQVGSQRFEAKADSQGLFTLTERLASALVYRVRPEQSAVKKLNATVSNSLLSVLPHLLGAELLLDEGSVVDIQRALLTFGEVDQALPNFGRPLCDIAQARCEIALRGVSDSNQQVVAAREAAEKAVALDPEMISARVVLAFTQLLECDWNRAENNFQQALDLGEHACGFRQYGLLLLALGRFDDASHYLQKAQQIDPFSARQKVAFAKFFYLSSRGEEAAQHFSDESVFGSLPTDALITLGFIHIQDGKRDEALRVAQECRRNAGAQPGLMASVAQIMSLCGETNSAKQIIEQGKLLGVGSPISHFRRALLHLSINEPAKAMSHLAQARDQKEAELIWLGTDPRLAPLRELPAFTLLLRQVMPLSPA
jgi:TolB-like protein